MENFTFSKEQNDIFAQAEKGVLNMIVQAVAGAGKTTTLVECANRISPSHKILILAHNRSTRDTLKRKIGEKQHIKIYTLHGLAWRMFTEYFGFEPEIDDDKYRKYVNANISDIGGEQYRSLKSTSKAIYKSNVFDLINKARHNLKQSEKEIKKLATKKYGIVNVANEFECVAKILKWGTTETKIVDYQDLLWFPSEFGYFTKKYLSDIIMLDEAQDASIAQQDIISRCFKRNTRLFAFGDRDQTINSWCGSDTESFEHLQDPTTFRRDAIELPLTTNYRCGKKIIEYAKKYTNNNIHAKDDAIDGVVNFDVSVNDIGDNDMVLCRNIAPLMRLYRQLVSLGRRAYFIGEDLGKNIILASDCTESETIDGMIKEMKERILDLWESIQEDNGESEKEAAKDKRLVSLMDTIKTMESLPQTVTNRYELDLFTKNVFKDEASDGIMLSTIHRAKGMESDNVFVICPSLMPSRFATLDWEKEEEEHLLYVMATRPKNSLNFVSEKEFNVNIYGFDNDSMFTELKKIRKELYGR